MRRRTLGRAEAHGEQRAGVLAPDRVAPLRRQQAGKVKVGRAAQAHGAREGTDRGSGVWRPVFQPQVLAGGP